MVMTINKQNEKLDNKTLGYRNKPHKIQLTNNVENFDNMKSQQWHSNIK